jgi:hypothetical protein
MGYMVQSVSCGLQPLGICGETSGGGVREQCVGEAIDR